MRPSKSFCLGCGVGLTVGIAIPLLALLAVGTVLQPQLTPILVKLHREKLRAPPITYDVVADYDWEVVGLDGQLLDMETLRGRTVFLSFWRDTCVPCLAEVPALNALYNELGDEISFVTVFVGKDGEAPLAVQREDILFPVYTAPEGWPELFDVTGTPSTFVIAPSGAIAFKHIGGAQWDDPGVVAFLRGLTAQ